MALCSFLLFVACLAVHSDAAEPKAERRPEVWMAVLHERPLTEKPDDWKTVRTRLDGIKFWSGQIDTRKDEALKPFVPLLAKDKIAVAVERMYWPPVKAERRV
jgi:hypothetical protein